MPTLEPKLPPAAEPDYANPPTDAMTVLFEATEPLLVALAAVATRHAARRPEIPAPAAITADARRLLAAACRILGRSQHIRSVLTLGAAPGWAELDAKLALAHIAFRTFRRAWWTYVPEVESHLWHTRELAAVQREGRKPPETASA